MFTFIKTVIPYLFNTTAIIQKKAGEFRAMREERYAQFNRAMASSDTKDDASNTTSTEAKTAFSEFTQGLGLASIDDINDIKNMIEELARKIELLSKGH